MTQHRRRQRRPLRRSTIWTRSTRLRAGRSCGSCSSTPPRRISVTVTSGDAVTAWCGTIGARCTPRLRLTTARSGGSCGGARPPSLPFPPLAFPPLAFPAFPCLHACVAACERGSACTRLAKSTSFIQARTQNWTHPQVASYSALSSHLTSLALRKIRSSFCVRCRITVEGGPEEQVTTPTP